MQKRQLDYPFIYKVLNALGKVAVAANLPIMHLDEESVRDAAIKRTGGLADFGDAYHTNGLLRLLDSAENDANLHPIGRFTVNDTIVNYLAQRLWLVEKRKNQPQRFQHPLQPPLIICGLARSGTTFLHKMLASDPAHRALPLWLLMRPFPEAGEDLDGPDPRYTEMERVMRFRAPLLSGIDAIHYVRSDTPEECILALGLTFNSLIFPTLFPVYGYMEWYLRCEDSAEKYREYRWLLQQYQSQEPEQRLMLKAPGHTANLAAIAEAVPGVMLVQTHRDPVTCIISAISLLHTYYRAVSEDVDIDRLANLMVESYESSLQQSIAFREQHPNLVYDVFYEELVSDPLGTVKRIYDHYDLAWSENNESALDGFINRNPKNKHGKHRYAAADYALIESEVADRLGFYCDYFGLKEPGLRA
jgi:hypothetical protein